MFGAILRFFRKLGYLFTGKVDAQSKELSKNPHVIQATYDSIIRDKTKNIQHYKNAVGSMIAQEEKKLAKLKQLTEDVNRLENLKEGAAAKAKSVVEDLRAKGISMDEIKQNEDYQKCLSAFNDFSSTLTEKNSHIDEVEGDIEQLTENIADHKVQLQQLMRDIDKLKEEASATVADIITAKEEEKINDMISGLSDDRFSKELQDMRDLRDQQKAKARISREMAGTDVKRQEAEFLEYAKTSVSSNEFDQLIGLAEEADSTPETNEGSEKQRTQLPEE